MQPPLPALPLPHGLPEWTPMKLWLKIVICVLAVQISGSLSGLLTAGSIGTWFAELTKPPGNPPNWVFGPVWTVLYGLMGLAIARIWHTPPETPGRRAAITAFLAQMLLNLAWTPVFFGAHRIGLALVVIIALVAGIALTIALFHKVETFFGVGLRHDGGHRRECQQNGKGNLFHESQYRRLYAIPQITRRYPA